MLTIIGHYLANDMHAYDTTYAAVNIYLHCPQKKNTHIIFHNKHN